MLKGTFAILVIIIGGFRASADETAAAVIDRLVQARHAALTDVHDVTVRKSTLGLEVTEYLEKVEVKAPDGKTWAELRSVSLATGGSVGVSMSIPHQDVSAQSDISPTQLNSIAEAAELLGREEIDGHEVFHLRADNLVQTQQTDTGEVTIHTIDLWIDAQRYVSRRAQLVGVLTDGEGARTISIDHRDFDYREVAGSRMFKPYQQTTRITGMLSVEQRAEMEESRQKMAELDQQLAQLPESQRAMIMRNMGPQLAVLEGLGSGDGMEIQTQVHEILVNTGAPAVQKTPLVIPTEQLFPAQSDHRPQDTAASSDELATAQRCLEERAAEAQRRQRAKRGFRRILSAAGRTGALTGRSKLVKSVGTMLSVGATTDDLTGAARDLGLTPDDADQCARKAGFKLRGRKGRILEAGHP